MIHKCPRCGYSTYNIANFRKHLNRKNMCPPNIANISLDDIRENTRSKRDDNEYICTTCDKKFATLETLRIHKASCKSSDKLDVVLQELQELKQRIREIEMIGQQNIVIGTVNASQNNVNVTVTQHATNNFLSENIEYVSEDFKVKCARKLDHGLIDFIKQVRFNPDHPESMNVKIHRLKQKTLYVYQNNRWEICDAKWTLEEMIVHGAKVLYQTILTHFDQEKMLEINSSESKIQNYLLSLIPRNDEKLISTLSRRLYALVLDNRFLLMEQENEQTQS